MLTFEELSEDAEDVCERVDELDPDPDVDPEDEVVEEAELWLSWLILFLSRSNSEIFLSKEAETAEAESPANKELKEQPKAKAASKGSEVEEPGVEGGEEKSRREDMGEEEEVVLLPLLFWFWKLLLNLLLLTLSSESRLRSKMRGGLFVKLSWSVTWKFKKSGKIIRYKYLICLLNISTPGKIILSI